MRVTIYDVARKAGVSTGTVSLALKNHPSIRRETRNQIRTVASNLRYRPNALARALALQRSHAIALVVTDVSNPFYGQLVHGVEETAHQHGYSIILGNSRYDSENEKRFIEDLMGNSAEGFIIAPTEVGGSNEECFQELKLNSIPFVLLRRLKGLEADYVMVDDEMASYNLTVHLAGLGYKAIGYIGNTYSSGADHERFAGYKKALEDNGLDFNQSWVRETGFKMEDAYKATKDLLSQSNKPRAVVAFSDILAMGAVRAAGEMGVKVPEDLGVVGFDDIEFASCCEVPLTTMSLPKRELGERACELLLQRMEEKKRKGKLEDDVHHIVLKAKLVIRKSCGAHLKGIHSAVQNSQSAGAQAAGKAGN